MKYINLLILAVLIFNSSIIYSQKEMKYKDVYQYVLGKDTILAYEMLKEFQEKNPYHANTYYQLGLIAQYWTKKYDALTQIEDVKYFLYHTGLYLNLSKKYIDDKEVRKNSEYYQGIKASSGGKISIGDVTGEIDARLNKNKISKIKITAIQNNYVKSIDFYNQCVELFLEINKNNSNLKELLLTVDDNLKGKINKLGNLYDSTIYNLNKFEKGIKDFTIKSYKQTHKIKPIETYRLEGLTYSSFLESNIDLWDFRNWVNSFNKTLNTDIKDIRHKIDSTERKLIYSIKKLSSKYKFAESLVQTKVKPQILFKIGKYDYNSVIVDLFNYQEATLNFIEYAQKLDNNIADKNEVNLKKKSKYYSELVEKKVSAGNLTKNVTDKINPRSIAKYKNFINSNFTNIEGFKKYISKQDNENEISLKKYLDNLKYFMYKSFEKNQQDTILTFTKNEIPLTIGTESNTQTKSLSSDNKGNLYIAGSVLVSEKKQNFVALMNNNKIKWFKTFAGKSSNNVIVKANNNGCFAVFSSIEGGDIENKIVRLDLEGTKKSDKSLESKSVVRYLYYDDINEKVLLAFYGKTIDKNATQNSQLEIIKLKVTEKSIELDWQTPVKIDFTGSFVDIVKINQNYYVFNNYSEYTDLGNNKVSAKGKTSAKQNNAFLTIVDEKGQKTAMKNFASDKYYYLTKIVKINDNLINLLGIYGDSDKVKSDVEKKQGEFYYMLINNKGEVTYK